jgi:hypothetical protein
MRLRLDLAEAFALQRENCWPPSFSVWAVFMLMPKRIRGTLSRSYD